VQDDSEEGIVDVDFSVVLDETQFSKFVHEEIDAGPRSANHLREHLLRHLGEHLFRLVACAVASEQEQSTGQPFFAGVEELVDQILLNPNVSSEHISDEAVGKLMFRVKHTNHLGFLNAKQGGGCDCGSRRHANGLTSETSFSKKIARSQDADNCFFTAFIDDSEPHAAFLNIEDLVCWITLTGDSFCCGKLADGSSNASGVEKRLHIERSKS
jgi:hypothetical protein